MKKRFVALLLVLVLVLSAAAATAETYYRIRKKVNFWQFPSYESRIMDTYRTDWALTVNRFINKTWANITFTNGKNGYVERSYLVRVSASSAWVKKDKIKVRRGPDYVFNTLFTVNKGDKVTVLTNGANYSNIKASAGYGYIENGALSKTKVSPSSSSSVTPPKDVNYTAWVISNGGKVGLRRTASGANSAVFAKYAPGTKVTVLQEGREFHYVSVAGSKGYMRSKYLSKYPPAGSSGSTTPAPAAPVYPRSATAVKKAPFRNYEGAGWYVAFYIDAGTPVTILAPGKDPYWVKVQVNGRTGYMESKYLK